MFMIVSRNEYSLVPIDVSVKTSNNRLQILNSSGY